MPLKGLKIGFLGGGSMGEALLTGLIRAGLAAPPELFVSDISPARLDLLREKLGVNVTTQNHEVLHEADVVILAVKPNAVPPLLKNIAPAVRTCQTFISIAAGISTGLIESCLAQPVPVVRAMPNTPCLVGEGASAVSVGKYAGEKDVKIALSIFSSTGKAVQVPESLLDCVTGLSGSGPAFMYMILEGFIDGAVRQGLSRDLARFLAAQTMLGSAKMVLETGEHPGKLKDMVTTPGGTTIAGLYALEEGALKALLMKAVDAATRRSRELSG